MTEAIPVILAAHALVTIMMAGVIWFVQIVHYPLMADVGAEAFVAYERKHVARTGRIVGPLMLVEEATAILLAITPGDTLAWSGAGLLGRSA